MKYILILVGEEQDYVYAEAATIEQIQAAYIQAVKDFGVGKIRVAKYLDVELVISDKE
jgi:hypothetical protein